MSSTLKYRHVMSAKVPVPSTVTEIIDSSFVFFQRNKNKEKFRPFQFILDDKVLEVPGYDQNIFSGFKFILEDTILLLKTMDNRFVVIYKSQTPEREYKLFSTQGEYLFDEVIDINCSGIGLSKVYAFCVIKDIGTYRYSYNKGFIKSKKIYLHKIGWSFTRDSLNGLDPERIIIEHPEGVVSEIIEFSELFGPLPQWTENEYDYRYAKNPWWVALCDDDKYRIMYNSGGDLKWILTEDKSRIEAFKRFIPTMEPNYFYFLTTENEELLIRAYEEYGSLEQSLAEARKGINDRRVNPYYSRDGFRTEAKFIFPGIKYETWIEKKDLNVIPGVFTQQEKLNW